MTPPFTPMSPTAPLSCVEICAGAGGQALGLEQAGFGHTALIEVDQDACATLRANRPTWNVLQADVRDFKPDSLAVTPGQLSLFAAGVPCPPFSLAGQQLGSADERDLFPAALAFVAALRPQAVLLENVKGLLQTKFAPCREGILRQLGALGYLAEWRLLYACDYGVPQLRPRAILVALEPSAFAAFRWPEKTTDPLAMPGVGETLRDSMASRGWELADGWAQKAGRIAPTLCGGSKKHGGPDLGPSRARKAWAEIGVNGAGVADFPPGPGDPLPVKLTLAQIALLQGFPPDWKFSGRKTAAYRQVGNAFPPPVAAAVGRSIAKALERVDSTCLASPAASAQRNRVGTPM
ncbi:DNA (cytosine-5-)-methyltransferase [Streptomyces lunaelactis]|nr:DNA (cytosine-5-)-methyltransferase [Streptomyces lunaelactis]NUK18387.1 DNA (cytosine-5-)-methyltransferase [Streptomyces lunaelactis]NUK51304.1 DNA (cytosine-5-)-methyltransferase [Streptomyces lunaelactis]